MTKPYRLLDCGDKRKVELFGDYKIIRPAPQALWKPADPQAWEDATANLVDLREEKGFWKALKNPNGVKRNKLGSGLPDIAWKVKNDSGLEFWVEANEFGNIGVFTEHWTYVPELIKEFKPKSKVLNLFTYTTAPRRGRSSPPRRRA